MNTDGYELTVETKYFTSTITYELDPAIRLCPWCQNNMRLEGSTLSYYHSYPKTHSGIFFYYCGKCKICRDYENIDKFWFDDKPESIFTKTEIKRIEKLKAFL